MDTLEYQTYDAVGLAELVKNKQVTKAELLKVAFERLDQVNPKLNAVVRTRKSKAVEELNEAESGGVFSGVPLFLKDISQAIEGEVLSAGSKLLEDHVSSRDSYYVEKARLAGFQLLGHSNTPEFGLKNITEPVAYGATRNPWHLNHSPGGSSGGAAALVASGVVPMAGASDGGGSIRIPAGFTGLFGLKPTRGRTPVGPGTGRQWQGAAIDFALSRTVRDSARFLDVQKIYQPAAAFHVPLDERSYYDLQYQPLKRKLRIAYTTASPVRTAVTEDAKQAVIKTVNYLATLGHEIEEIEAPINGVHLMQDYYTMNAGEMHKVIRGLERQFSRLLTADDLDIFTYALHKVGKEVSAADFSESLDHWDLASANMEEFHHTFDLYITPTNAAPAPEIGELTPDQAMIERLLNVDHYTKKEQLALIYDMFLPSLTYTPFTQLANLTGQPAMSIPVSLSATGLPLGCQVMAAVGREDLLLSLAFMLEASPIWLKQRP